MRRIKFACGYIFIWLFCRNLLVLAACAISCAMHAQNVKPTANPDTCFGTSVNVLKNDTDPNGDWLKATKFNGISFVSKASIIKKDTGAFILDSSGLLYCSFQPEFHGEVRFTYYVNDGKGSTAARQTGKILVIRNTDTSTLNIGGCPIEIKCVKLPECIDDSLGWYCVRVRKECEWISGCLSYETFGGVMHYYIRYTDGIKSGYIEISEDQAIYIQKNTCRK